MVKSSPVPISVTPAPQTPGSVSISPPGPLSLVLPQDETSIQQTFTGQVLDNETTPQPIAGLTVYGFLALGTGTATQVGTAVTNQSGNYTFTLTLTPASLPAGYTFNISTNSSNT